MVKVNKWKDPWFYYKVIAATSILLAVLGVYLYHMITQTWSRKLEIDYPFSYLLFQGHFLSFFTYQSNLIIGIWFLIAAIYHNKKNKMIDSQNITMAITCYISVTCFIFILVLLPVIFSTTETFRIGVVLGAIFFHIITPVLMIGYTFSHVRPWKITAREYYHKSFWLYLIYPWVYTLFLGVRLTIYATVPSLKDMPLELVYPYLPLLPNHNIHDALFHNPQVILLIVGFFVVVHISFVLFNITYFYSIEKINENQKKNKKTKKKRN